MAELEIELARQRTISHQIDKTLATLGVHARRWRTPWNVRAPWTREIAAAHDLELCGWDVDSHDGRTCRVWVEYEPVTAATS